MACRSSLLKLFGSLSARGQGLPQCASSCRLQQVRCFGQPAAQTHPHLLQNGEVTPGITQAEYKLRRYRLIENISRTAQGSQCQNHIVIIPSAHKVYMTEDIPYPFRQNTEFLYLCGFMEPNSLLILETDPDLPLPEHKATLFVPKKDPAKELWEGARSGIDGAVELTGVNRAYNTEDLNRYLSRYLGNHRRFTVWYDFKKPVHPEFHNMYITDFLRENRTGFVENPRGLVQALRVIKSPAEINLMRKSCEIASRAFKEVMKFSHPLVNEAHLYAKMDFECRLQGAEYLAYPPVVAGGNRANTIHYVSNNQLVHPGDMVLMDAGCEYHGYSSDITRTWPVSGTFTPAQQELYEAVLEVQQDCIDMCYLDSSIELIFHEMLLILGHQLQRLGILSSDIKGVNLQRAAREFCPHHVGHYLGMDVHDTDEISRGIKLQDGMAVTIEPGIYVPASRQDVPMEFRGTGIRIEDDILVTVDGPVNLTSLCPKYIGDIEGLLEDRPRKS